MVTFQGTAYGLAAGSPAPLRRGVRSVSALLQVMGYVVGDSFRPHHRASSRYQEWLEIAPRRSSSSPLRPPGKTAR